MTFSRVRRALLATLVFAFVPAAVVAQNAVTISGHVTAGNYPVRGASVGVAALGLSATTGPDGQYSFIVPSSRVRGQRVTLTARYLRYEPQSVEITLVGGTLIEDFQMTAPAAGVAPRGAEAPRTRVLIPSQAVVELRRVADSSAFGDLAGTPDLGSALAGRVVGLQVTSASTLGGSSVLQFRGPHSIAAPSGPLFVVDGFPVDNSSFNSQSEEFGAGGFDYGAAIRDLNLGDIESVTVLDQAQATLLYGGRAANGVVFVRTKRGEGLHGFDVAASQQVTFESPVRLSSYQNAYGQGLNGLFEFFDGTGGGINDGVAESWGPALAGQPVTQASLTEQRRPDVRLWLAQPNNVSGFFAAGRTFTTNASAQGASALGNFRIAASDRSITGLTPGSEGSRQTLAIAGGRSVTRRLTATITGQFINDRESMLPGAGFNAGNPAAGFAVMGRQVDLTALRSHVVDTAGDEINWIYTNWNNPYFESAESSNESRRSRVLGGVSATYAFAPSLAATARIGTDSYHETRDFTIAPTWMGGFPFFAGEGDFSGGGFQNQGISVHETNADVFVDGGPTGAGAFPVHLTAGLSHRGNGLRLTTAGSDRPVIEGDTVTADQPPAPEQVLSDLSTNAAFGAVRFGTAQSAMLNAALRAERVSSGGSGESVSNVYSSVSASVDIGHALGSPSLNGTQLHASWSRTGSQLTPAALRGAYFGLDSAGFPNRLPADALNAALTPELTNTWDAGVHFEQPGDRFGLDLTYYHARGSNLLLPGTDVINPSELSVATSRSGVVSNSGIEAQVSATPVMISSGFDWNFVARYGRNHSRVESLGTGTESLALGPSLFGLSVEARTGEPLPALVGFGYLRDPTTGELLLENGHPLPDSLNLRVLGSAEPAWTGSFENTLRYRAVRLDLLVDAHVGGKVFSATNMWGQTSGTLAETAFRPDSGLLISGIDATTGQQNTTHVSTQDYYHSLLPIQEAWVYDATFVKLREARLSVNLPLHSLGVFTAQSLRASLIGRNLWMAARAPNIDPETALSVSSFQGAELGQPLTVRSVGLQLSIVP